MVPLLTTTVFLQQEHYPEDGSNIDQNMLVRIMWIKYITECKSGFCWLFIYFYLQTIKIAVTELNVTHHVM